MVIVFLILVFWTNYEIFIGYNSYSQLVANYTGSANYPSLSLSSNYAYVVFMSGDDENTGNGFTISWTSFSDLVDPCFNSTSSIRLENQGYWMYVWIW